MNDPAPLDPLRLCFVDHCARLGGAGLSMLALVEDLHGAGHRCTIMLAEDGPLANRLRAVGASVQIFEGLGIAPLSGAKPGLTALRSWLRLMRAVRSVEPDVIHVNSAKCLLTFGPLSRISTRVPIVWSVRDVVGTDHFSRGSETLLRIAARAIPHTIVANSHFSLASVGARAGAARAVVVYPGVGPVDRRPGIERSVTRIVALGRLAPWKGQDVLIEAVDLMHERRVEIDIIGDSLFGEQDFADLLRDQIHARHLADRVTVKQTTAAVEHLLAEYDVLVHCARKAEAFGRVVAEGLMAGLAVIATDSGGPSEQLEDGRTGLLVEPGSAIALACALDQVVADAGLRRRLGTEAVISARRFSRQRQLEGYLDVYGAVTCRSQGSVDPVAVSLVVPSYGRPDSLDRTLRSISRLQRAPLEVLVVARPDDHATRATAEAGGARIVDVFRPGLAAAMSAGADAALGDVVAFTDDDAEPNADWIDRIVDAYSGHPRLGVFGGRDVVAGWTGSRIASSQVGRITWFGRVYGGHHQGSGPSTSVRHLKGVNLTVRREVLSGFGLADRIRGTGAQHGNEMFICLHAARSGWAIRYDPDLVVVHHAEERQDGSERSARHLEQIEADVANRVSAVVGLGRGVRRLTVPLYAAAVGERPWPGVARVVTGLRPGSLDGLSTVGAVLRGVWTGLADSTRANPSHSAVRIKRRKAP